MTNSQRLRRCCARTLYTCTARRSRRCLQVLGWYISRTRGTRLVSVYVMITFTLRHDIADGLLRRTCSNSGRQMSLMSPMSPMYQSAMLSNMILTATVTNCGHIGSSPSQSSRRFNLRALTPVPNVDSPWEHAHPDMPDVQTLKARTGQAYGVARRIPPVDPDRRFLMLGRHRIRQSRSCRIEFVGLLSC